MAISQTETKGIFLCKAKIVFGFMALVFLAPFHASIASPIKCFALYLSNSKETSKESSKPKVSKLRSSLNESSEDLVDQNEFTVARGFNEYVGSLGKHFPKILDALGPQDIWLDAGAGIARAQLEFLLGRPILPASSFHRGYYEYIYSKAEWKSLFQKRDEEKPQLVAAAYKKPTQRLWRGVLDSFSKATKNNKLQYLEGDIVDLANNPQLMGQVALITEVKGPSLYSKFDAVMAAYLALLKPGGKLVLADPLIQIGNPKVRVDENGNEFQLYNDDMLTVVSYLKRGSGFDVSIVYSGKVSDPETFATIIVTRNQDAIYLPPLRLVDSYDTDYGMNSVYEISKKNK